MHATLEHEKGRNRNKPCFCKSGKKYKHCHMNKESEKIAKPYHLAQAFKNGKHSECNAPESMKKECVSKIINAHTVSKSSSLKPISRDGHVYKMAYDIMMLEKNKGQVEVVKEGINKASTFTGFCAKHDKELFSAIEDEAFIFSNEQLSLIIYRALVHEIQMKKNAIKSISSAKSIADSGAPLIRQLFIQYQLNQTIDQFKVGVKDLQKYKDAHERIFKEKDYSSLKYVVIEFDKPLPIMASGCNAPTTDFDSNILQSLEDANAEIGSLFYSSLSCNGKGYFCFIWNNTFPDAPERFVKSFYDKFVVNSQISGTPLLNFLIERCENIYLECDWWDGLPDKKKRDVKKFFVHTIKNGETFPYIDNLTPLQSTNITTNFSSE